jgi:hypothetical protein
MLLVGHSAALAGPQAVPGSLPEGLFNERTIAVVRMNLTNVSSAQVLAAVRAIVPDRFAAAVDTPNTRQQLGIVDAFAGQLRSTGAEHLTAVAIVNDPANITDLHLFLLLPLASDATAEQRREQVGALSGLAESFGGRAEESGSWAVLHNAAELPAADVEASVYEAAFFDALAKNPDHDLAVVFVPPDAMREALTAGKARAQSSGDVDSRRALESVEPLTNGEWYYLSVRLGANPELRLATHLAGSAQAAAASDKFNDLLDWSKGKYREQLAREKREAQEKARDRGEQIDPAKFDPEPVVRLLDAIKSDSDQTRVFIHLDRPRLQKVVEGLISMVEAFGEALGKVFGEALLPD